MRRLGVRWTVGDVSRQGFEALQLSLWGAARLFGEAAELLVCVNTVPLAHARSLTGEVPPQVRWREVSLEDIPPWLRAHFDDALAEGVGWKFAPLRAFQGPELALDNDCILWELPQAVRAWLEDDGQATLFAEDVRCALGQFEDLCAGQPRNSGIRGLGARFDLEAALRAVLAHRPVTLKSELDEQGLQAAAVSLLRAPHLVTIDEVSLCSPFAPHRPTLGRCGAHFVGLNARRLGFEWAGRNASEFVRENFARLRAPIEARLGRAPAEVRA